LNSSEFFQKIGSDPTRRALNALEAEYEARADKATKEEKKAAGPPAPAKSELLELLKNLFPEGLPLLVACIKGTKKHKGNQEAGREMGQVDGKKLRRRRWLLACDKAGY